MSNKEVRVDFPFDEVVDTAIEKIKLGFDVNQSWTCQHCRLRQDMAIPNKFFEIGICQDCKKCTDIKRRGCNYTASMIVPIQKH